MVEPQELKRSPLHEEHVIMGAKLVPFSGWEMPVHYSGILGEHHAVREGTGVFDISHMGEFFVSGAGAVTWLDGLLANRVARLGVGQGQYTLLCNDSGGVIDDLILYRTGESDYFLVVNAAKVSEDLAWLQEHRVGDVVLEDRSTEFAAMAVQGVGAAGLYAKLGDVVPSLPDRNGIVQSAGCIVCRTGYTGDDGFEFFCPAGEGVEWLRRFVAAGAVPCGLGARDSLRLEMGYPLNGSDLGPDRTPLEAGLGFFVDLEKDFVGVETMRVQKTGGLPSKLTAFTMLEKGPPPRHGYPVLVDGQEIGRVTSGGLSPCLGKGIGMAYLPPEYARPGTPITVSVRDRPIAAETVKKPIYRKPG